MGVTNMKLVAVGFCICSGILTYLEFDFIAGFMYAYAIRAYLEDE